MTHCGSVANYRYESGFLSEKNLRGLGEKNTIGH